MPAQRDSEASGLGGPRAPSEASKREGPRRTPQGARSASEDGVGPRRRTRAAGIADTRNDSAHESAHLDELKRHAQDAEVVKENEAVRQPSIQEGTARPISTRRLASGEP